MKLEFNISNEKNKNVNNILWLQMYHVILQ